MPTYEYRCTNCGEFEVEQRMTDDPLAACPSCGGAVKKLMPRKLFVSFKGPGFHINDYPNEKRKRDAASDAPAPATTAADSKPAAAADSSPAGTGKSTDPSTPAKTAASADKAAGTAAGQEQS
jgi:putative FmdB family regulatory protein